MEIFSSLTRKAHLVYTILNAIDGVTSNKIQGALYAFPKINLPQKAIDKAEVSIYVNFIATSFFHNYLLCKQGWNHMQVLIFSTNQNFAIHFSLSHPVLLPPLSLIIMH